VTEWRLKHACATQINIGNKRKGQLEARKLLENSYIQQGTCKHGRREKIKNETWISWFWFWLASETEVHTQRIYCVGQIYAPASEHTSAAVYSLFFFFVRQKQEKGFGSCPHAAPAHMLVCNSFFQKTSQQIKL
jgi:hypothetical protein